MLIEDVVVADGWSVALGVAYVSTCLGDLDYCYMC